MPEYLKTNENKAPIIIHYIENYSADEVLVIMKKQDFDFQNFFNKNPASLAKMLQHFSIDNESQNKVLQIWKAIDYKFKPDDILYYIDELNSDVNSYFYKNIFDYIIKNGTDLDFKKEEKSIIEIIFEKYIMNQHHYMRGTLEFISRVIKNGMWDLSVKDSNKRDSLDYIYDILKNNNHYNKNTYTFVSKYKNILLGVQCDYEVKNKQEFLSKSISLNGENKEFVSHVLPSLFLNHFSFIDIQDLNMGKPQGEFLNQLISYIEINKNENSYLFNQEFLLTIFEIPVLDEENKCVFIDENNFESNFKRLSQLTKDFNSSYAHFTYLYANKDYVKNIFNYAYLIPETLERIFLDNQTQDKEKTIIYNALIDFFSYKHIFENDVLSNEFKKFLSQTTIDNSEMMLKEFLVQEEKYNIQKIIKDETIPLNKKRL